MPRDFDDPEAFDIDDFNFTLDRESILPDDDDGTELNDEDLLIARGYGAPGGPVAPPPKPVAPKRKPRKGARR